MRHSTPLRRLTRQQPARALVALVCAAALLTGCGGGDASPLHERIGAALESAPVEAPATQLLVGFANLDRPVQGAEVALHAPDGEVLARGRSDRNGGFVLQVPPRLPRDFLITATGGEATPAFDGTLLLVQDDFDSNRPTLHVNVASTLAAHVLAAGLRLQGTYTPAQAEVDVRRHLALPEGWSLGHDDVRLFDASAFLQAQEGRPLDDAFADRAYRIVSDTGLVHPYRRLLLGNSIEDDALNAAVNVSVYGLEYLSQFDHPVTEAISGWGMAAVNWLRPDYSARFDQIDRKLKEMSAVINTIDRRIARLNVEMVEGFSSVLEELARLRKAGELQAVTASYQQAAQPIAHARQVVLGLQDRYMAVLRVEAGPQTGRLLQNLADDILRQVPAVMHQLKDAQAGTGPNPRLTSAAANWHQLQAATAPHYPVAVGSAFFDALNQQQDEVAGLQVLALNLLMEAHNYLANAERPADVLDHLDRNVSPYARDAFVRYSALIRDTQAAVAYPRIQPGLVANLHTGRLFARHAAAMKMERQCTQLHLAWTETGSDQTRELRTPTPDCDFRFLNAANNFNAMRPFGHADWAVGAMPAFIWDPKRNNFDVAMEAGYDFSAIFRHTQLAVGTQFVGVANGQAVSYAPMDRPGEFTVFTTPVNSMRPLQEDHDKTDRIFSVFFSRSIPRDEPLVSRCNVKPDGQVHCTFGS